MTRRAGGRRRWAWLGALVAAAVLVLAFHELPVRDWIARLPAWAAGLGWRGMLLFAGVYLLCALLFGPAWLVTLAIGLAYGFARGLLLVSAVSTLGAAVAFLIARHLARRRVEELVRRKPALAAVDRAIGRHGWKIVFLLRLSAVVPYTLSNYVYGVTAIRFWPYVLASWIGMLPITAVYVSIGAAGRAAVASAPGSVWRWVILGAGVLLTVAVGIFIARVSRRELMRATGQESLDVTFPSPPAR
jgi:uncharacterized membrane protein YdjX (TVP38/TMEM64 family)